MTGHVKKGQLKMSVSAVERHTHTQHNRSTEQQNEVTPVAP